MNAESRALLRKALLRGCEAAAPASLPEETLRDIASAAGYPSLDAADLRREIHWLTSAGFMEERENAFESGRPRWRITAAGMDALARM